VGFYKSRIFGVVEVCSLYSFVQGLRGLGLRCTDNRATAALGMGVPSFGNGMGSVRENGGRTGRLCVSAIWDELNRV
jgi:hypothetical protein